MATNGDELAFWSVEVTSRTHHDAQRSSACNGRGGIAVYVLPGTASAMLGGRGPIVAPALLAPSSRAVSRIESVELLQWHLASVEGYKAWRSLPSVLVFPCFWPLPQTGRMSLRCDISLSLAVVSGRS
jgi:hypothetical protein